MVSVAAFALPVNADQISDCKWHPIKIQAQQDGTPVPYLCHLAALLRRAGSVALSLPFKESCLRRRRRRVYPTVTCLLSRQERNGSPRKMDWFALAAAAAILYQIERTVYMNYLTYLTIEDVGAISIV